MPARGGVRPRMIGIYFFLKLMLFFALVKALVKSDTLGEHPFFFGVIYTGLVAFISYVFILSTNPNAFRAAWLLRASRSTHLSPWMVWLAATLLLSTAYFKLLSKVDGIGFWIVLVLGIPLVFF
jgi:hypothetical protein